MFSSVTVDRHQAVGRTLVTTKSRLHKNHPECHRDANLRHHYLTNAAMTLKLGAGLCGNIAKQSLHVLLPNNDSFRPKEEPMDI